MHFPKHWAKGVWRGRDRFGVAVTREAWGWSDVSEADARARAEARARKIAEAAEPLPPRAARNSYPYPRGPLREPVLRAIPSGSPDVHAVITRNSLGCEVLNTDRVVFIDVDLPPPKSPGLFAALFGRKKHAEDARIENESAKIALLEQWQRHHPELAFRVYRTAAGLRYVLTSALASPGDPIEEEAFAELGVDPNYRRMCGQQRSFRARLTAKPWRCGIDRPPHRFPFPNAWQAQHGAAWQEQYERAAGVHATCLYLIDVGMAPTAGAVAAIVAEHDRLTRATSGLPLA